MGEMRGRGTVAGAYGEHGVLVCRMASAVLGDPRRAGDVAVEVFGALANRSAPRADDLRDWLMAETLRRSIAYRPDTTGPAPPASGGEPALNIWAVLAPADRQVLALASIAGWSCSRIGAVLGLSEAEVQRQVRTALLTIRALAADTDDMEARPTVPEHQ